MGQRLSRALMSRQISTQKPCFDRTDGFARRGGRGLDVLAERFLIVISVRERSEERAGEESSSAKTEPPPESKTL